MEILDYMQRMETAISTLNSRITGLEETVLALKGVQATDPSVPHNVEPAFTIVANAPELIS